MINERRAPARLTAHGAGPSAALVYRCYAKVNLTLEVVRRRDDGYHEIASVAQTIGLFDELRLEPHPGIAVSVPGLDIPPEQNLVTGAAELLRGATRVGAGARLTLRKGIPVAAGLGGGSTDAAGALVGLNRLWNAGVTQQRLTQLAASLGSDVPFLLRGGAAALRGQGEVLEQLPAASSWLVLLSPTHHLADKTRMLYHSLNAADFSSGDRTQTLAHSLVRRMPLQDGDLFNSFARAARACFPGLAELWKKAQRITGRAWHLSGAGPTLFMLARDSHDARAQRALLAELRVPAHVVRTVSFGHRRLPMPYP